MAQLPRTVEINLAAIPVAGFGGMCLVVASLVCAAALPQTRWFMLAAFVAGIVFGVAMIFVRRAGEPGPTHGDQPLVGEQAASLRRSGHARKPLGPLRAAQI